MAYTDLDALAARFGERMLIALTDRAQTPSGTIDLAALDRALAETDALIDGYLAVRYRLPLADTPALVAALAQDIAIWKLHPGAPDAKVEADYKAAIRTLEALSNGSVRLNAAGAEPATTGGGGARSTDRERPMTAGNLKGFI